ncbi:MAG: hypothetical protein R3213_12115, partial [Flavobacteriaceae bacterium]|nr:hypothetical protein [Flavobacteriaceae bacterium]
PGIPKDGSYVETVLPALGADFNQDQHVLDLDPVAIQDVDPLVAISNLESELQDQLDAVSGYYDSKLGLDAADTITANVTITKFELVRDEENDLLPGNLVMRTYFTVQWEQ